MIRQSMFNANGVYTEERYGGVAVLEREPETNTVIDDNSAEVERRRRNLEKLLNYEVYEESAVVTEVVTQAVQEPEISVSEEDIRPTTTTMQFGEGEVNEMYNEMQVEKEEKSGYQLTMKGKIAIALYSVAVAIVMALIVLNTGVLAKLSDSNQLATEELATLTKAVAEQEAEISSIDDAYVMDYAEDVLGMVLGSN